MKYISRKPISCTSPPKCLQVRPCADSCNIVTMNSVSQTSSTVSQRSAARNAVASSRRFDQNKTRATTIHAPDAKRNERVQQNPIFGSSQAKNESGSQKGLRQ